MIQPYTMTQPPIQVTQQTNKKQNKKKKKKAKGNIKFPNDMQHIENTCKHHKMNTSKNKNKTKIAQNTTKVVS